MPAGAFRSATAAGGSWRGEEAGKNQRFLPDFDILDEYIDFFVYDAVVIFERGWVYEYNQKTIGMERHCCDIDNAL